MTQIQSYKSADVYWFITLVFASLHAGEGVMYLIYVFEGDGWYFSKSSPIHLDIYMATHILYIPILIALIWYRRSFSLIDLTFRKLICLAPIVTYTGCMVYIQLTSFRR